MADPRICAVSSCDNPVWCKGWCQSHYNRWRRHGDPLAGRQPDGSALSFLEQAIYHSDDECLIWPYWRSDAGHARIHLDGRKTPVARVICERLYGPPPSPRHEAAHSCGKGHLGCVNPKHLRWATHTENERDKVAHGTAGRGEKASRAKLNWQEVQQIRALCGELSQKKIGDMFGVSRETVSAIHRRVNWPYD